MSKVIDALTGGSRPWAVAVAFGILVIVGIADWLTGHEISFSTFYLLAIGLGAWSVGTGFGILLALLSVAASLAGDMAAGAVFPGPLIPAWNVLITAALYVMVVSLLGRLRTFHGELEERVRERTAALAEEMAARERLQAEILGISEQEQQRIGRDLHDTVGQHLTATALAGQVLADKLAKKSCPEAAAAQRMVQLLEQGIDLSRKLAHGLSPMGLEAEGLVPGLRDLAARTTQMYHLDCRFHSDEPVRLKDSATAIHLYRIAQEAVTNAIKHGQARRIVITLARREKELTLSITDDGVGFPAEGRSSPGLGLRSMAYRAGLIGASFDVRRGKTGGAIVTCTLKNP